MEPSTTSSTASSIGARIKTLRLETGSSLSELATRAGVSKSYLSTVENGIGSRPGAAFLYKIAGALGVTLADLIGRRVEVDPAEDIPESLREFAQSARIPVADIEMLAGIKFRGHAPQTPDRWRFIYDAIVMSGRAEERG